MTAALACSLTVEQLAEYSARQLNYFFPDPAPVEAAMLKPGVHWTLERMAKIHRCTVDNYYFRNGEPYFDHLHGDQYATYIYLLSRFCGTETGRREVATKLYLLNRALFAVDIFFEVQLPEIFALRHPAGTVLGRASYQDYLVVLQNCTVGNIDDAYPEFGRGTVLCSGASVLGRSKLGDSVCVGAGSLLINLEVPSGHTAVGCAKDVRLIPGSGAKWQAYFRAEESLK